MATSNNSVGAIILGNSGVGKSFLGNIILGREAFKHQYKPTAVTLKTEYQEASIDGQKYAIYNIPGLIEADQERIELNKREIDVSFRQHPNAVVLYVCTTNNGRVKNEDIVAFNAINTAYPLSEKALIVVVNGVKPDRASDYDADMITTLSSLLKMHLPHVCFVNQISQQIEQEPIHRQLIQAIQSAEPKIHKKEHDINLQSAEISKLIKQIEEFQKEIEKNRQKYELDVKNLKEKFEERERQQKAEEEKKERKILEERIKKLEEQNNKLEEQIKKLEGEVGNLKVAQTSLNTRPNIDLSQYKKKPCSGCYNCLRLYDAYYHVFHGGGAVCLPGVGPRIPAVVDGPCYCNCHQE